MATQLPKYKQQIEPVADTTALKRNPDLASNLELAKGAVDATIAQGFGTVAQIGGEAALMYRDSVNKTYIGKTGENLDVSLENFKENAKTIDDEDVLKQKLIDINTLVKSQKENALNNVYGQKAKRQIEVLYNTYDAKLSILGNEASRKIANTQEANMWWNINTQGVNKEQSTNPNTASDYEDVYAFSSSLAPDKDEIMYMTMTEAEAYNKKVKSIDQVDLVNEKIYKTRYQVAYEDSVNNLLRLGQINEKAANKMKSDYGQFSTYKEILTTAGSDILLAKDKLEKSNLSEERYVNAFNYIVSEENKVNEKIQNIEEDTYKEIEKAIEENKLSSIELKEMYETTESIQGIEFNPISESKYNLFEGMLTQKFKAEGAAVGSDFTNLNNSFTKVINEFEKEGTVNSDTTNAFFQQLGQIKLTSELDAIGKKKGDNLYSIGLIQSYLGAYNQMIQDTNPKTRKRFAEAFSYGANIITSTFTPTLDVTDNPTPLLTSLGNQINNYSSFVDDTYKKEGRFPTPIEIDKYLTDNIGNVLESNAMEAIFQAIQTYKGNKYPISIQLKNEDDEFIDEFKEVEVFPEEMPIDEIGNRFKPKEEWIDTDFLDLFNLR